MSKLELLEEQVKSLSADELESFQEWFEEFEAGEWDREIEAHAKAGKIDAVAEEALLEYEAGHFSDR